MKSFTLITLTALAAFASAAPAQHEALAERQVFRPGPSRPRCDSCNPLVTTVQYSPRLRVATFPPRHAKHLSQGPPAEQGFSHITRRTPAAPAFSGPKPGASITWHKDTQRQGTRRTMQGPLVEKARGIGGREGGKRV
ncbi:hypothetical protein PSV09DRAFT_2258501 [Bipolaris maydis]|uniref:uncharacterized protein n=1 Tax=Cochliobolus heterostrophus TaxID=5016 RepID=UPI0024D2D96F|nr:hypothetical protein J3E74DRAFT_291679 [Bipolaris maydis]KAJ6208773.1 hypothetical protein PSV09DRAFT_2258501 [Bipolaris maydis]KAJ6270674.1 hypothetical protein PSV08DRAFT_247360 [Bipolaris maydis]KAJ6278024.1 hypothetical protein J3E71DRAFT_244114 [Bipolaris maydis]